MKTVVILGENHFCKQSATRAYNFIKKCIENKVAVHICDELDRDVGQTIDLLRQIPPDLIAKSRELYGGLYVMTLESKKQQEVKDGIIELNEVALGIVKHYSNITSPGLELDDILHDAKQIMELNQNIDRIDFDQLTKKLNGTHDLMRTKIPLYTTEREQSCKLWLEMYELIKGQNIQYSPMLDKGSYCDLKDAIYDPVPERAQSDSIDELSNIMTSKITQTLTVERDKDGILIVLTGIAHAQTIKKQLTQHDSQLTIEHFNTSATSKDRNESGESFSEFRARIIKEAKDKSPNHDQVAAATAQLSAVELDGARSI